MSRSDEWNALRPRFQSMLFRLGYQETARRVEMSCSTVYDLVNGTQVPWRRTLRDLQRAVVAWEDSDSERCGVDSK